MLKRAFYKASQVYKRVWTPISLGCRALVVSDGKVLLVRHSYQDGWYFPGGAVERGETLREAVTRELAEECAIAAEGPVLMRMYFSEMEGRSDHVALFRVDSFEEIAGAVPDGEIAESRFFVLNELPEATSPATRRRLAEAFGEKVPDERW